MLLAQELKNKKMKANMLGHMEIMVKMEKLNLIILMMLAQNQQLQQVQYLGKFQALENQQKVS